MSIVRPVYNFKNVSQLAAGDSNNLLVNTPEVSPLISPPNPGAGVKILTSNLISPPNPGAGVLVVPDLSTVNTSNKLNDLKTEMLNNLNCKNCDSTFNFTPPVSSDPGGSNNSAPVVSVPPVVSPDLSKYMLIGGGLISLFILLLIFKK